MKIEDILKVKFLKIDEKFESYDYTVVESNIEANSLVELLTKIESQNGIGKSIHEEAFTGIDYQGNKVKFCSYLVWTKDEKIYKYNFDENFIPLNQSNKTVEVFTKEDIEKLRKNIEKIEIKKITVQNVSYDFLNANAVKKLLNFNNF